MRDGVGGQKQAPCREPNVGLDPESPGSRPELKAALNHWAPQSRPSDLRKENCCLQQSSISKKGVWYYFLKLIFELNNFHCALKKKKQKLFFKILFEIESKQERAGAGEQREEKQAPHWAGSRMWGSIPGPQDHDLSRRQMLNQLHHPGIPPKIET